MTDNFQDVDPDLRALAAAVRTMRDAQKMFFKTRDRALVPRCRALERDVDRLLEPTIAKMEGRGPML